MGRKQVYLSKSTQRIQPSLFMRPQSQCKETDTACRRRCNIRQEWKLSANVDIKRLTSGNWLVQDIIGFNLSAQEVIIASTEVSPLQSNIYGVNIKTGKRHLIGKKDATHSAELSASGQYLIDRYSSPSDPRTICVCSTAEKAASRDQPIASKEPLRRFCYAYI